jgi:Fe2+ or Zn2+ uptake regulation protein
VLVEIQKTFPTLSRATVYNTLEALTRAGVILRITVDPAVARYDADLGPHAHFRCRLCGTVYDVAMDKDFDLAPYIDGHAIEAVRTYAYGVCSKCLKKDIQDFAGTSNTEEPASWQKTLEVPSVTSPISPINKGGEARA